MICILEQYNTRNHYNHKWCKINWYRRFCVFNIIIETLIQLHQYETDNCDIIYFPRLPVLKWFFVPEFNHFLNEIVYQQLKLSYKLVLNYCSISSPTWFLINFPVQYLIVFCWLWSDLLRCVGLLVICLLLV